MVNNRKVAIVGCGFVGSSIAFTLMQKGMFNEMVLIDYNKEKAVGEAMPQVKPLIDKLNLEIDNDREPKE